MWKRNQSMMAEMSKWSFIDRVIFVNPTISVRTLLEYKHNHSNSSLGDVPRIFLTRVDPKISVYSPITFFPCKNIFPVLDDIEQCISLKMIRHANKGKPYILFMNCPNIASPKVLDALLEHAAISFFDISDDFPALGYDSNSQDIFRKNMEKYVKASDVVLTVNEHVKDKYAHLNDRMHVIRNGTNYENFNRQNFQEISALERIKGNGHPIIGYIGMANMGRIDSDLLDYLIGEKPDWHFVFLGSAHENFIEQYAHYENVHILDPVHYQELPCYIRYFDVAFVPFRENENTKGNDLLKLHDFLAMGKPIVCREIGGAKDLEDVLHVAGTPLEFLESIEQCLALGNAENAETIARRKKVALKNSWQNRVKELEEISRGKLGDNNKSGNEM